MNKNKPLILVVNDDGISSPGIILLKSIMREIGEVYVVAPKNNCSGYSHAMTLNQEISVYNIDGTLEDQLFSGLQGAGHYKLDWNASIKSSGIYFIPYHNSLFFLLLLLLLLLLLSFSFL